MILQKSAVFVGCARDCEIHLDAVLANIANAAARFAETAFIFVENDSVDATAAKLAAFGRGMARFDLQTLGDLGARHPLRTERLAIARNRYLELIDTSDLRSFDYLIVYDMDDVNAAAQSPDNIANAARFLDSAPEHAGVFANQLGYYYDLFALRHPTRCPGDAWEEVFDYVCAHGVTDEVAFNATYAKRMFNLDPRAPLVEVDSAFGGLGVYRLEHVIGGRHVGIRSKEYVKDGATGSLLWQTCEHVSLHARIRSRGGRLFIAPWMLNAAFDVAGRTPAQICSPSVFRALYRLPDRGTELAS